MLRNRLIFGLIHNNGSFMQSRNFRLQRVGDIGWLEKNYKFQKISFSLDELFVFDATRDFKDIQKFSAIVNRIVENVFIPVAAGGGIRKIEDVEILFEKGADKVVLNSSLYSDPSFVAEVVSRYGSQSVVASIDYRVSNDEMIMFINDGMTAIPLKIEEYLKKLEGLGVGEIVLNSVDKDGTGFGYDIDVIEKYAKSVRVPFVIMGGAGNEQHLREGLAIEGVSGVVTANLFNFIGDGLPKARDELIKQGFNLAKW